MKIILFLLLGFTLCFASCNEKEKNAPKQEVKKIQKDSSEITIALLPTLDCIPFYIATQGIYDSLGIKVKATIYRSQMDAEQSIVEGVHDGCATDLFRVGLLQNQKAPIRFLFNTQRNYELIVNKVLRISKVEQLNDRMIAMDRNSTADYLCDFIAQQIKSPSQILRPQINSFTVRQYMLESNQIDAAILPQALAIQSRKKGNTMLPISQAQQDGLSGFAISTKVLADKKLQQKVALLLKGYNLAVDRLTANERLVLPKNVTKLFLLDNTLDSVPTKKLFKKGEAASPAKVSLAIKWLHGRDAIKSTFNGDTLLYSSHKYAK